MIASSAFAPRRSALPAALLSFSCLWLAASVPARAATPRVHAIVGARIVTAPGHVIERGTLVIRDGLLVAVGEDVPVPADARVWPGDSLTVYPGLIDPFVVPAPAGPPAPAFAPPGRGAPPPPAPRGPGSDIPGVTPENRAEDALPLAKETLATLRGAGFAAAQVAPREGILRGSSAVVGLGDGAANANVVSAEAAQVIALDPSRVGYPNSLMGAIAVVRQSLLDARWYRDARAAYARAPQRSERPATNLAYEALQSLIARGQPAVILAGDMLEVLRAAAIAREAGIDATVVGGGDEYKRVRDIAATGLPLIVPIAFPDPPDVSDPDAALDVATEDLRRWQDAPGNPAALERAGVTFALTSYGLKDTKTFRAQVARAVARGLSADAALAAVTTAPAHLLGLDARLGTLAPGKIADLTVTRGPLFSEDSKVREVWVDGNRYEVTPDETSPRGDWSIDWGHGPHALRIAADRDTTVTLVVGPDSLRGTAVRLEPRRVRFTMKRGDEPAEDFDLSAANDALTGTLSVAGVGSHPVHGRAVVKPRPHVPDSLVAAPHVAGDPEAWRAARPEQPAAVLVRNATIWTAGPRGTLQHADLLVRAGKIAAVGPALAAPAGAVVIDGTGKHVAPGIIDEHSHSAIVGGVNECTHSVTCEVRIQDVVNSESTNLYRQLAGGVTILHLLHGSCNSIGGQCAVIKNRWGEPPDALLMAGAPPTVKFALGENPKQANWGPERSDRYPQSRGGVEETIREAFLRARDYRAAWAEYRAGRRALPPRTDLQAEALVEILDGRRVIHCHSYRQDEILMLMRVAEEFGFKVGTFTHVLEGYKVADEIAAHGASALGFSDWWAYKYEVIDAIPWNGYLLWDRGVNTGFNSDSDELARRLNTEAAKAIKYGGVPPEQAIQFVTLNPAKSLGIDARVGSLEVGKDADFAIWNGSPLSPFSLCEQTWVDGRRYFDRAADLAGREALARERDGLILTARAAKKQAPPGGAGQAGPPPRYLEDADLSGSRCGSHGDESPFRSGRYDAEVER